MAAAGKTDGREARVFRGKPAGVVETVLAVLAGTNLDENKITSHVT